MRPRLNCDLCVSNSARGSLVVTRQGVNELLPLELYDWPLRFHLFVAR